MDTGLNSGIYKLLLVLHILAAIIGFGSVFLAGVFASKAQARGGREGLAVTEVLVDVAEHWSEWFIYAVPLLGIGLIVGCAAADAASLLGALAAGGEPNAIVIGRVAAGAGGVRYAAL